MKSYKVFQNENHIGQLFSTHSASLNELWQIETDLKDRFLGLDEAIEALILAVASGESLLLIGPPGTAKSRLIEQFCTYLNINVRERDSRYFKYLLTPFTEPNELFGFLELVPKGNNTQGLQRRTKGMMQDAEVVFLDEVFNASSPILNALLTFMNERKFYDSYDNDRQKDNFDVALQCLFGASNFTPQRERRQELSAVFDRFLLRAYVENVDLTERQGQNPLAQLLAKSWTETYGRDDRNGTHQAQNNGNAQKGGFVFPNLLPNLRAFQDDIRSKTRDAGNAGFLMQGSGFFDELRAVVESLRSLNYSDMSNRRITKMLHVMLVHVLYQKVKNPNRGFSLGGEEIRLLRFAVDRPSDRLETILSGGQF